MNEHIEDTGLEVYAKPPSEVDEHTPVKEWEEYVSAWMTVQELGDMSRWTLGDIGNEVMRAFGTAKDSNGDTPLDKFAVEVGQRKDTVWQYARVSKAFPRREDRNTKLSYSHYRAVYKTQTPMKWIDEAVNNNWTVAQLQEQVKNYQDAASVAEGRPCTFCGEMLPETGSIHVRRNGIKEGSFCSDECLVFHYSAKLRKESEQSEGQVEEEQSLAA